MLSLVVDTSTPAVTAGLVRDGVIVAEQVAIDAKRHGELLSVNMAAVLQHGTPDEVVVGVGPGPFTGLRVGIVSAAAYADALGLPVRGVCSLEGMRAPSTAVVTDARRKEVYWAVYDESGVRTHGPDVGKPADVLPQLTVPRIVGDGAQLYGFATDDTPRYPSVALLATSAESLPLTPLYLRRPDAQEMAAR